MTRPLRLKHTALWEAIGDIHLAGRSALHNERCFVAADDAELAMTGYRAWVADMWGSGVRRVEITSLTQTHATIVLPELDMTTAGRT